MQKHRFWHPFCHHFGSLLALIFNTFSASIFACFLDAFFRFWIENDRQKEAQDRPCGRPLRDLFRILFFDAFSFAPWLTFGSPLCPVGSLLVPVGSLLVLFWLLLVYFWCPWVHFCLPSTLIFSMLESLCMNFYMFPYFR